MYCIFVNGACYDGRKYKTLGEAVGAAQQYNATFGVVCYIVDKRGWYVA